MRLTENLHLWVLRELDLRCQQLGITDELKVIFYRRQVLAMPVELTEGRRTTTHKCLGVCYAKAKTIFINVKKFTTRKRLRRTLIHELIHYRFDCSFSMLPVISTIKPPIITNRGNITSTFLNKGVLSILGKYMI